MKTTFRVGVIGRGVVGCSVLCHLTRLGWSDIMLGERCERTSSSTWHAAGRFHTGRIMAGRTMPGRIALPPMLAPAARSSAI